MKLLLDTHIWLWMALDPDRLASRVGKALDDPENELWLSSISVWELTVLCRKGRFRTLPELPAWVANTMGELRLIEAPLTVEVALAISALNLPHNDPADGFIAATAKVFGLTLVTADEQLAKLKDITVLPNR
ncbi:MAG: type II toxin-antitoxin system VapC family toxin [Candidatus Sulfotelmatobacter sp.]